MEKKTVIITESGKLFCKNEIADNDNIILWNPSKKISNKSQEYEVSSIFVDFDIYMRKPQMLSALNTYFQGFNEITVESAEKIVQKVISDFNEEKEFKIPDTENRCISRLLDSMGFKNTLDGYEYIRHAIFMGLCEKGVFMNLKRNIYEKIGKRFGKNPFTIERSIRFAVKDAFLYGNLTEKFDKCPANSKLFITLLQNLKY